MAAGHSTARRLSTAVILSAVGAALGFSSQLILARVFAPDVFGLNAFAIGIINVVQVWCLWGMPTSVSRFAPGYVANGRGYLVRDMMWLGFRILAVTGGVLAVVMLSPASRLVGSRFSQADLGAFWLLLMLASAVSLISVALSASGRVTPGVGLAQVLRPALVIAFCGTAVILGQSDRLGRYGAIGISGAATLVSAVASLVVLGRHLRTLGRPASIDASMSSLWLKFSTAFVFSEGAVAIISNQSDTIVVGSLLGLGSAAVYYVALQIAAAVTLAPTAVQSILHFRYASLVDSGRTDESKNAACDMVVLITAAAVVSWVGVLIVSPLLIKLFGHNYPGAYAPSVLLGGGVVGAAILCPAASSILAVGGQHRVLAIANACIAAVALALSIVLTRRFGLWGTASASVIVGVGRGLTLLMLQHRLVPGQLTVGGVQASMRRLSGHGVGALRSALR